MVPIENVLKASDVFIVSRFTVLGESIERRRCGLRFVIVRMWQVWDGMGKASWYPAWMTVGIGQIPPAELGLSLLAAYREFSGGDP